MTNDIIKSIVQDALDRTELAGISSPESHKREGMKTAAILQMCIERLMGQKIYKEQVKEMQDELADLYTNVLKIGPQ